MKLEKKLKAIKMRKSGKSYKEILKKTDISKGTLSLWLRDIKLTQKQEKKLYSTLRLQNAYKEAKNKQKQRIEKTKKIIAEAKKEVVPLLKNTLFVSGLMLYWAEGDKSKVIERVKFTNSDPEMIILAMEWFRKICKVPENKFRITLHIHTLHCRKNIEKYWSEVTKIPLCQFYKTQIKPTSLKHRKNKLYNGTCAISVYNKNLFRKIEGWKLGFLEKMNIKIE